MPAYRFRLDRFIFNKLAIKRSAVKPLLAAKKVRVNQQVVSDANMLIDKFDVVDVEGQCIQNNKRLYFVVNKPRNVVSATQDKEHQTVLDFFPCSLQQEGLHLAGRLDFNSTGLVVVTNDGHWSRKLSQPATKVMKWYRVQTAQPIEQAYIEAFLNGFYFEYEQLHTLPAELKITDEFSAELALQEGKYHQVRRMFAALGNKVTALHRYQIGEYRLPSDLGEGEYRAISPNEVMPE